MTELTKLFNKVLLTKKVTNEWEKSTTNPCLKRETTNLLKVKEI